MNDLHVAFASALLASLMTFFYVRMSHRKSSAIKSAIRVFTVCALANSAVSVLKDTMVSRSKSAVEQVINVDF